MTVTLTPFADGTLDGIVSALSTNNGEPTMLLSDDGSQIDLWFSHAGTQNYHGVCTDGSTFGSFAATTVPSGYLRNHVLKDGGTYYLYAAGSSDTTIHLFTGTDGLTFTDQGQVLSRGSAGAWDSTTISNSFVWREGASSWYMVYEGSKTGSVSSIGLATASAAAGPWTKYSGNPVITGTVVTMSNGCGNPELPRFGSAVTKYGGLYYCYFHGAASGGPGPINRAYSSDLHTWTVEGAIDGVRITHTPVWNGSSGWSYGDHCLVPFGGKTYLFYSPSNQVDTSYIDGSADLRTEVQLLAFPCSGAQSWTVGSVPVPL